MKKAIITVEIYLETYCPYCDETINILQDKQNNMDNKLIEPIINNKWEDLEDEIVLCPECDHDFRIEKVEF